MCDSAGPAHQVGRLGLLGNSKLSGKQSWLVGWGAGSGAMGRSSLLKLTIARRVAGWQ